MGCVCMKQRLKCENLAVLASQTCFKVNEIKSLYELLRKLSSSIVDDGLISKVFHMFDTKRDGVIEFEEFVRCLSVFHLEAPQAEKANTSFIERKKVKEMVLELLKESDLILSNDSVEVIIDKTFEEADLKGDEKIDLKEWNELVNCNPSLLKNMTIPYLKYFHLYQYLILCFITIQVKPYNHQNAMSKLIEFFIQCKDIITSFPSFVMKTDNEDSNNIYL
ncbi:calcineurin B-like protein 5 [Pyrus x bretschneideri]|uniref:Calcineurin B-like protein n=1 Tax=Pyrus x bretschneideri TaxID=225117 RepID=A0A1W5KRC7_9ROSA|nr:calcineurin B-like protein 5 [Pyrus x bretschneideri]AMY59985.1 calcineurin B-like protein 7 [Pyrus x bretschneideri]